MLRTSFALVVAGALGLSLAGCQQPSLDEMMVQPPRPAELDRLNAFVGTWECTSEAKMVGSGETMPGRGTSTVTWEADKWLLVERSDNTVGAENTKYASLCVWSWDAGARKYRVDFFDNFGGGGSGTATYDEAQQTWHMAVKTNYGGQSGWSVGTARFTDPNTMQWEHAEWDSLKLTKYLEMKGTSHRK